MMFDMFKQKKKPRNKLKIAGIVSLAAMSGALATWYTSKRFRKMDDDLLFGQDEESQL